VKEAMATAAQVREHYDFFAPYYRAFWGDHIHHGLFLRGDESPQQAQVQMLEHCVRQAGIMPGARVLDVGCGHGGTLIYLAQRLGCHGVGMTLSEKQVELARREAAQQGLAEHAKFVVANADDYDFPAVNYDVVWTMESSEHFGDRPRYFRNVAKTLRPGGVLLLAAWTGDMQSAKVRAVAEAFVCPDLQPAESYAQQLEAAGMSVESREEVSQQVRRTWEICQQRVRWAAPIVKMLPTEHRRFVEGIEVILDAYRCGDLSYTIITAKKSA
jgi:cyclopropane fatty-acyl-phospholipid synthase-like methyltransferase